MVLSNSISVVRPLCLSHFQNNDENTMKKCNSILLFRGSKVQCTLIPNLHSVLECYVHFDMTREQDWLIWTQVHAVSGECRENGLMSTHDCWEIYHKHDHVLSPSIFTMPNSECCFISMSSNIVWKDQNSNTNLVLTLITNTAFNQCKLCSSVIMTTVCICKFNTKRNTNKANVQYRVACIGFYKYAFICQ